MNDSKTYFVVLSLSFGKPRGRVLGAYSSLAAAERERQYAEKRFAADPNGKYSVVRVFDADEIPEGLPLTV